MLETLIQDKKAKIGIIGMGYVGLPLAIEFARAGFSVTGFEVDARKVEALGRGTSYVDDISDESVRAVRKTGKLSATLDFSKLAQMNAIVVCVPTPLRQSKDPDVSYIVSAGEKIKKHLRKGQLVVLESTTYPGTTRELLLPMFEENGLKVGTDFCLAFSPERVDPGNKKFTIRNTPKVVGGITPRCSQEAIALYSAVVDRVVPVSSPEAAELVKLLENTFRAVNIGLANEVALMCDRLKLDTWEIIDAAATKPFGFMPFYPGPGLGGHCIPLDPHYLSWKLKTLNYFARFIELAGEINAYMPEHLVRKVGDALNEQGKSIKGSKILVLGLAYKKDIGDVRESPAVDVTKLLIQKKAEVSVNDPFVEQIKIAGRMMKVSPLTPALLKKQDCVVITTNHSAYDIAEVVRHSKLVVDSRNAAKGIRSAKVVKL